MEIIQYTAQWVKGEITQGRIMVGLGVLSILIFLYFADFQQDFFRGMVFPFVLFQILLLGYGGFQMKMRPRHLEKVINSMQNNPTETLQKELEKAQKDDKVYNKLKTIWVILFVLSLVMFFVLKSNFGRGVSFGFFLWFLSAFIFDTFLHQRLKIYLTALQQIS